MTASRNSENKTHPPLARLAAAVVLAAVAGVYLYRTIGGRGEPGERGFFYDVSAKRIFTGPRDALPPIRGVDGPEEDGFRALVISTNAQPRDSHTWQVAYLEKFSPELRRQMTAARERGEALAMGRAQMQAERWVRRLTDTEWQPMNSDAGEAIVNSWASPGPDGVTPVVCVP